MLSEKAKEYVVQRRKNRITKTPEEVKEFQEKMSILVKKTTAMEVERLRTSAELADKNIMEMIKDW